MSEQRFLGIEIGGTKLQFGVGAGDGSAFVALERRSVDRARGAAGILRQIAEVATELAAEHQFTGVGIGFGGPVDAATGCVTTSHQVSGWDRQPLGAWCTELLGVPTVIGNDCDVAALAEARFGAGQGSDTVLYITVGTSIGGGLVLGGELLGRGRPAVAEIGHLRPGLGAATASETVESLVAGPGIALAASREITAHSSAADAQDLLQRCGGHSERLTAQLVAEAAASGNDLARATLMRAVQALGWAIAQAITLTAADAVVIGGGLSLIGEQHFFQTLRAQVAHYVFPLLLGAYEIVPLGWGRRWWCTAHWRWHALVRRLCDGTLSHRLCGGQPSLPFLSAMELTLRPITPADNAAVANVIRTVMPEFGCVGEGFSIEDPEVDDMAGAYGDPRSAFFVIEDSDSAMILAVAGYGPLTGGDADTCELRKMYALPAVRGKGAGRLLIDACVAGARHAGFRRMYLETVHAMTEAAHLYRKHGFEYIPGPMGGTGHSGCDRFMLREL